MRQAFVITIQDNEESVRLAKRCIASGKLNGIDIEMWPAVTPRTKGFKDMVKKYKLDRKKFDSRYSRADNAMACFLSHATLWEHCISTRTETMIFEHDAILTSTLPRFVPYQFGVTFSKPSYGAYNTPTTFGVSALTQKPYFGGAHGYMINSKGAAMLVDDIPLKNQPTDIYLNLNNFEWLQEYYPWICHAQDDVTTIQKKDGCAAKHSDNVEIIDA